MKNVSEILFDNRTFSVERRNGEIRFWFGQEYTFDLPDLVTFCMFLVSAKLMSGPKDETTPEDNSDAL